MPCEKGLGIALAFVGALLVEDAIAIRFEELHQRVVRQSGCADCGSPFDLAIVQRNLHLLEQMKISAADEQFLGPCLEFEHGASTEVALGSGDVFYRDH